MVYVFINLIIGAALMSFAFTSEHVSKSQKQEKTITSEILMLSLVFLLKGITMGLCFFAPKFLCVLVGRMNYVLISWYCTGFCKALLSYKKEKSHKLLTIMQWILNVAGFIIIFAPGRGIIDVYNNADGIFTVESKVLVPGMFNGKLDLTWFDCYMLFYVGILQILTVIMVFVRSEYVKDKLLKQNLVAISLGAVLSWLVYGLLMMAISFQPSFRTSYLLALIPELVVLVYVASNNSIWGKKLIFRTFMRLCCLYLLPSLVLGCAFLLAFMIFPEKGQGFVIMTTVSVLVVFFVTMLLSKFLSRTDFMRNGKYEDEFEEVITSINYDENSKDIEKIVQDAFVEFVESSYARVAIDAGTGFLETVGDEDESQKIMVPMDQEGFDVLLNVKHSIVFRSYVEKNYQVKPVRESLLEMMDKNNADAFILLNEGRRIVGAIFLGKKSSGDIYNDYDYKVFKKLYSSFFVVGYYMKNMMNESVVGTVNREIRMSSQIITSIQENMDYIINEKVDCGYRMVPAHNIGGEFIDMIRLNDSRHMFVIGALSGKGIAASMSMVVLKSVIRTNLAETKDFKLLISKINSFIRTGLPKGTFFAGLFGIIDFSNDTLYYINCGTPALFMYNHLYNNVIEIQGEGHVLGFAKDIDSLIRVKKVKLTEGDIIFACTDGLIESKSLRGESYGKTRVQSQIMENATYPAAKMGQFIHDGLLGFTSRALEDDITMLIIKQMK